VGKPLLLVGAAQSYGHDGEDRRTELLATALDTHIGFCRALSTRLQLTPGVRYAIETQHWASPECRIDLTMKVYGENGERTATIYSEHKIEGYWFSDGQIQRERSALEREPGDGKRLICVIPAAAMAELTAITSTGTDALPSDAFDHALTWEDIVGLIDDAGRNYLEPWGGPGWSERALSSDAPACQRVLAEFLFYLEGEEKMTSLTEDEIRAFQLADQAEDKIATLMMLASSKAGAYTAVQDEKGELLSTDESDAGVELTTVDFEPPERAWLSRFEDGALSFALAAADAESGDGTPTVYGGLYLDGSDGEKAESDGPWMSHAVGAEFRPLPYRYGLWLCRSIQLAWVVTEETVGLEEQAKTLGAWLAETFDAVLSLPERTPTPPAARAPRPGRRR
jgi:hypothetical protein